MSDALQQFRELDDLANVAHAKAQNAAQYGGGATMDDICDIWQAIALLAEALRDKDAPA